MVAFTGVSWLQEGWEGSQQKSETPDSGLKPPAMQPLAPWFAPPGPIMQWHFSTIVLTLWRVHEKIKLSTHNGSLPLAVTISSFSLVSIQNVKPKFCTWQTVLLLSDTFFVWLKMAFVWLLQQIHNKYLKPFIKYN